MLSLGYTMKVFLLSLLLFRSVYATSAFLAPAFQGVQFNNYPAALTSQFHLRTNPAQQAPKNRHWGQSDGEDQENLPREMPSTATTNDETQGEDEISVSSKILQLVFTTVSNVFGVFFYAAGGYFTFGLLLNLCGYGYYINREGFQVDTLQHMRQQNQFEREYQRLGRESESRPPSSLPK